MEKKAEYRSSIRSRENIRRAYAELINEKGSLEIKVKDLVERADVNRSTFYAHYQDIYSVLEEIQDEVIRKLFTFFDAFEHSELLQDPLPFLQRIGTELESHKDFYGLLVGTKGSYMFTQKLKNMFIERLTNDQMPNQLIKHQKEFILCVNLLAGGGIGLYCDWLTDKIQIPITELVILIRDVTVNAMKQFI